jgi:hypothetical protein
MAYADIDQFRSKFPRYPITDDTAPSVTDVEGQLVDYSAILDAVLSQRGYDLPISAELSLDFLRAAVLTGTGWWYTRTVFPNATGGLVDELRREWEWLLTGLTSGAIELPGTDLFPTSEIESYMVSADADDIEAMKPFVTRKQQF